VLAGAREAPGGQVREVPGRRAAIAAAVGLATAGDVVAVLGKGHERGQEVAGRVEPFDDRTALAEALAARGDPR
jgi:UDP-N-acetylmuramoyl-L-alanyl-D-glutamate--2,6-diaminopimelate ligase